MPSMFSTYAAPTFMFELLTLYPFAVFAIWMTWLAQPTPRDPIVHALLFAAGALQALLREYTLEGALAVGGGRRVPTPSFADHPSPLVC